MKMDGLRKRGVTNVDDDVSVDITLTSRNDCHLDWFIADLSQCRVAMTTSVSAAESSHTSVISALYEHNVCQWPVCDAHCTDISTFYK